MSIAVDTCISPVPTLNESVCVCVCPVPLPNGSTPHKKYCVFAYVRLKKKALPETNTS
jgi:hypothetical protein